MKKINLLAMLFLLCHTLIFAQADTPHFLSSTSWELVDIQAEDGSKLSEAEDNALGAIWHFITEDSLIIEKEDGFFGMPYSFEDDKITYLSKSIEIEEKQVYHLLLSGKHGSRLIKATFMKTEALDTETRKEAIWLAPSMHTNQQAFYLSFGVIKPALVSNTKEIQSEKIYKITEIQTLPRFPGCEAEATEKAKNDCATKLLLNYIYSNIRYPAYAREYAIEGTVILSFIVEKDGTLSDIALEQAIGGGCDEEALRVVQLMNKKNIRWIAGTLNQKAVRVRFNLPVKFKLQ